MGPVTLAEDGQEMESTVHGNTGPSAWWYLLAVLVFVVGEVIAIVFFVTGFMGVLSGLAKVVVPGSGTFTLPEPGKYVVFYEYHSVVGNRTYATPDEAPPGLECTVAAEDTGGDIPLSPATGTTFSGGNVEAISLWAFEVQQPGVFVLSGSYPEGEEGPDVVLSIHHSFKKLLSILFTAMKLTGVSFLAALVIALVVFSMRRRAEQQALWASP